MYNVNYNIMMSAMLGYAPKWTRQREADNNVEPFGSDVVINGVLKHFANGRGIALPCLDMVLEKSGDCPGGIIFAAWKALEAGEVVANLVEGVYVKVTTDDISCISHGLVYWSPAQDGVKYQGR